MKTIILFFSFLLTFQINANAGKDKVIKTEDLPLKARQFIETNFARNEISLAKMDPELFDKSYEVFFTDGNTIEFDGKGEWTEIKCKYSEVPTAAVPEKINKFITEKHPGTKVIGIERDPKTYEIKLDNGIELTFDTKFNLIDIDH